MKDDWILLSYMAAGIKEKSGEYQLKYPKGSRMNRAEMDEFIEDRVTEYGLSRRGREYFLKEWEAGLEIGVIKLVALGFIQDSQMGKFVIRLFEEPEFETRFLQIYNKV